MNRIDPNSPTHGLPPCMHIPIAAADVNAIEEFVGVVEQARTNRKGEVTAMLVRPHACGIPANNAAPLWREPDAAEHASRLYPESQVWVHVDYARYRDAYIKFGTPPLKDGEVLDHVQNRKAMRLRWYSHPYLRLCPVDRAVNSDGGHTTGAEGIEKDHLEDVCADEQKAADMKARVLTYKVVYADPADLTKMLNMPLGKFELENVGMNLKRFYP
jgi:hypothetical protein